MLLSKFFGSKDCSLELSSHQLDGVKNFPLESSLVECDCHFKFESLRFQDTLHHAPPRVEYSLLASTILNPPYLDQRSLLFLSVLIVPSIMDPLEDTHASPQQTTLVAPNSHQMLPTIDLLEVHLAQPSGHETSKTLLRLEDEKSLDLDSLRSECQADGLEPCKSGFDEVGRVVSTSGLHFLIELSEPFDLTWELPTLVLVHYKLLLEVLIFLFDYL